MIQTSYFDLFSLFGNEAKYLGDQTISCREESASAPDVYIKDKLQNVIICDLLGMKEHIFNFDFLSLKRKQLFVFSLER